MLIARTTKYREIIQVSTLLTLRRYQCVYMALRLYTEIQKALSSRVREYQGNTETILENIFCIETV